MKLKVGIEGYCMKINVGKLKTMRVNVEEDTNLKI